MALTSPCRTHVCTSAHTAWGSAVVRCVAAVWMCSVLRAVGVQVIISSSIDFLCLRPVLLLIWPKGGTVRGFSGLELWRRAPKAPAAWLIGMCLPPWECRSVTCSQGGGGTMCEALLLLGERGAPHMPAGLPDLHLCRWPVLAPHGGLFHILPLCSLLLRSLPLAPHFVSLSHCRYSQWLCCLCNLSFGSRDV